MSFESTGDFSDAQKRGYILRESERAKTDVTITSDFLHQWSDAVSGDKQRLVLEQERLALEQERNRWYGAYQAETEQKEKFELALSEKHAEFNILFSN